MQRIITRNEDSLQVSWQKELANSITDPAELLKELEIDPAQFGEDFEAKRLFGVRVPRHFVSLMEKGNPQDPLLLQVMPLRQEFNSVAGYSTDPLAEQNSALPGLLHKYKSRVLFIFKAGCAVNCRYCFRRHFPYPENSPNKEGWQDAIDYVARDENINEVILSGGDPLMANNQQLQWLLGRLAQIKHLRRLRIHTRLPVVMPSRIDNELCEILKQHPQQVILVTHINHPNEISSDLARASYKLKSSRVTLLNQGVLLAGVNDDAQILCALSEALFAAEILPYYLFLLDKVEGAAHFDVSQEKAQQLLQAMLEQLPGFLIPKLTREEAGKTSKTPIPI
ncbi:EF-P beta-lysylation protein EpmB [Alginatibacterium sediminis]|uniref:L-lysine 2,3-aminomutase n=1 Tax=Alginatibacterium sediminis TaxID=2164068 RepID=A0A420E7S5_9ALTE|nr:EF-P beta-lysylation protein EpmB [Alginatibacterium sediminis]RKF14508.1 EF-P beta-lysylation protein EpmB [Alginatibacterium sediminis]